MIMSPQKILHVTYSKLSDMIVHRLIYLISQFYMFCSESLLLKFSRNSKFMEFCPLLVGQTRFALSLFFLPAWYPNRLNFSALLTNIIHLILQNTVLKPYQILLRNRFLLSSKHRGWKLVTWLMISRPEDFRKHCIFISLKQHWWGGTSTAASTQASSGRAPTPRPTMPLPLHQPRPHPAEPLQLLLTRPPQAEILKSGLIGQSLIGQSLYNPVNPGLIRHNPYNCVNRGLIMQGFYNRDSRFSSGTALKTASVQASSGRASTVASTQALSSRAPTPRPH